MFDFAGVLVLIVLIVCFGWPARLAWRSTHRNLKWPALMAGMLLTLVPALLLVLALVGFAKLNQAHANPIADAHVAHMPWPMVRAATSDDLKSIYNYLHILKPHESAQM